MPTSQFQVEAYTLYLRLDVKCHLKVCVLWVGVVSLGLEAE